MVNRACNPTSWEAEARGLAFEANLNYSVRIYVKKQNMGLVVCLKQQERLPSKHEALSSNPDAAKKNKKNKIWTGEWLKK
jgi:hypothetical protein